MTAAKDPSLVRAVQAASSRRAVQTRAAPEMLFRTWRGLGLITAACMISVLSAVIVLLRAPLLMLLTQRTASALAWYLPETARLLQDQTAATTTAQTRGRPATS